MSNIKEAKELDPNQDLKINAGLIHMWKKAGLRVTGFKATKKGHNEIWSGEFKTKNAILSMSVNKYGNVFYHAGNKSVNIGRLDKQSKIIEWMKAIIKNSPWSESVNEAGNEDRKWSMYVDDKKIKTYKSKRAAVIAYNKFMKDTDNWKEVSIKLESVNEDGRAIMKSISNAKKGAIATGGGYSPFVKMGKNAWKQKKTNTKSHDDGIFDKIGMFKDFMIDEKIERGNEVHAETKKELKAAIAKSMREILDGKVPKYDIINGMTGEMIAWKDGKEYIWQPSSIPYAERELK